MKGKCSRSRKKILALLLAVFFLLAGCGRTEEAVRDSQADAGDKKEEMVQDFQADTGNTEGQDSRNGEKDMKETGGRAGAFTLETTV